jgi:enoyl-CoA hydratase
MPEHAPAQIVTETHGRVGLVRLDRPQALNALSAALAVELLDALEAFDADPAIGAMVVTGSEKAFAAGADIREMAGKTFADVQAEDFLKAWDRFPRLRKPVIAAVRGFALGGGCELAMMCDFVVAGDDARFGQPEITLGVIPGMGGTQRLARLVGRSLTMDMILTGRMIDAAEAKQAGLVARVVPAGDTLAEAMKAAETIAGHNLPAVILAKEAVHRAEEIGLAEGLRFERRQFHSTFATEGRSEGMAAFLEKRKPAFPHR